MVERGAIIGIGTGIGAGVDTDRGRAFRVRADSLEDLEIVSSMLQDAIVPIAEIAYQPRDRRFIMMAQRFRWEIAEASGTPTAAPDAAPGEDVGDPSASRLQRVLCALRFENVTAVRTHGIDLSARGQMLELLSMHLTEDHLDLAFAGDKTIRLTADSLSCHVEDIGEPWPTSQRPNHPEDDG
jgi:hypothetical protein